MEKITLRQAGIDDIPACMAMLRDSDIQKIYYPNEEAMQKMFTKSICSDQQLFLAVDSTGAVAGALKYVPRGFCGLYGYIALLAVAPEFQGRGIARFLISQAEQMADTTKDRKLSLLVSAFNHAAKNMYRHLGFYEVGKIPNAALPDIDEILMLKDIL